MKIQQHCFTGNQCFWSKLFKEYERKVFKEKLNTTKFRGKYKVIGGNSIQIKSSLIYSPIILEIKNKNIMVYDNNANFVEIA